MTEELPAFVTHSQPDLPTSEGTPGSWSPLGRFCFRIAFCFLLISAVSVTEVVAVLPLIGRPIKNVIDSLWEYPAVWLAHHVFHLADLAAHPHSAASRDTALSWITMALVGLGSLLCAVVWTALDRHRRNYRVTAAWLRFLLRLTLVFLMFRYGLFKVFPLQMSPPSLAVLNEPLGNTSQMTLLWTLIALHPAYEMICGVIEVAAAVLLVFRRTALLGALLTVVVLTNVLLYNLFFDVPVKLGAAIILVFALAVVAPDFRSLYAFFWRREPTAPSGVWTPPGKSRAFRLGTGAVEIAFVTMVLLALVPPSENLWAQQQASLRNPSPLTGEWLVESALFTEGGHTVSRPVLTGEGLPMTALFLEPDGQAMARSSDGKLWRAEAAVNTAKHSLALSSGYFDGERFNAAYAMNEPDPLHLILTPSGRYASTNGTLLLTRVPLPTKYPLLSDGFRWVSEFPLER